MKLANRGNYLIERALQPFVIPNKVIEKMTDLKWAEIIQDAENVTRSLRTTKNYKPKEKIKVVRKKVNYKADESLIHEPFDLASIRRSRKWKQ